MELRERAARGLRVTTAASLAAAALQVVQLTVLARLLTPADFGLIGAIAIGLGLASHLYDAGLGGAVIHRQRHGAAELSTLYWLQVGFGFAAFALAWTIIPWAVELAGAPRLGPLLRAASLTLAVAPLGKLFESLLQRDLEFSRLSRLLTLAQAAGAVTTVALAVAGLGVWAFVAGQIVLNALYTGALLAVGLRFYRPQLRFRPAELRGFVDFGLYQLGERWLNFAAERLDQVAVGLALGQEALGYYAFASSLALQPLNRINPVVSRVALPVLARLQEEPLRLQRGYLKLVRLLVAVNAPLVLGLAAVAPLAVPLIFGTQWRPAVPLIQVLTLVSLQRAVGFPSGNLLVTCGRADWSFRWNLGLFALSLPLVGLGAFHGGALAVAWSLVGLQLALKWPAYALLVRPLIGPCGRAYLRAVLGPCAIGGVMAASVLGLDTALGAAGLGSWGLLGFEVAAGATIYAVLLGRFEPELAREARGGLTLRWPQTSALAAPPAATGNPGSERDAQVAPGRGPM